MQLKIGADPEMFAKLDGQIVSAFGLIPGNKKNPFAVDKGAVQVDGMALEFNIDPASSKEEFIYNITHVMEQLKAMVPNYSVVSDPVAYFTEDYLKSQPEEATILGCDPDFNAWYDGMMNPSPDASLPLRTAAGHVHLGFTEGKHFMDIEHILNCSVIVRQLDFYLGLPSLLFDPDTTRRSLYGKAGAFRPKEYGLEYRVLSNKWLSSPNLIDWVFSASSSAMDSVENGDILADKYGDIQEIINNSDVKKAAEIIIKENLEVPNELS